MPPEPAPRLQLCTPRLRLRTPDLSDSAALAGLMTEEISRRLASWPHPCDAAHVALRIEAAQARLACGAALALVVEHVAETRPIGWISLALPAPGLTHAMLTYWLGEDHQGRGYMREAAGAAVRMGFAHLDIASIRAAVQPDNGLSISILRGLGMRRLGPGHIWCEARGREEACEYWDVARPALSGTGAVEMSPAALPAALRAAIAAKAVGGDVRG
jgi:ribosomal-protein-alanine N-acetyltransferase